MSGGHFNYQDRTLKDLREQLAETYLNIESENTFSDTFKEYFKFVVKDTLMMLDTTYESLQRIDYLVSGDDSEESFKEKLEDWVNMYVEIVDDFKKTLQYKP